MSDQQRDLLVPESKLARLEAEAARLQRGIALMDVDLQNAEMALRVERRKNRALKAELEDRVVNGPQADDIERVFDYWRKRCEHPKAKLDTKRATVIRARLTAGHDVTDLLHAVDGAMLGAFTDERGKRHDELELIMRDEVKLDGFLSRRSLAIRTGYISHLLRAFCLPDGVRSSAYSIVDAAWGFKCPVCRMLWDRDDYFPLKANRYALWCDAVCVSLSESDVRKAIDVLPPG